MFYQPNVSNLYRIYINFKPIMKRKMFIPTSYRKPFHFIATQFDYYSKNIRKTDRTLWCVKLKWRFLVCPKICLLYTTLMRYWDAVVSSSNASIIQTIGIWASHSKISLTLGELIPSLPPPDRIRLFLCEHWVTLYVGVFLMNRGWSWDLVFTCAASSVQSRLPSSCSVTTQYTVSHG